MQKKVYFPEGVALVIGGTGGLGKAISLLLAESGSNVAIIYRSNKKAAEEIVASIESIGRKARFEQVYVEKLNSVEACVKNINEYFGKIHTVIYASGPDIPLCYVNQITYDKWYHVIENDVNGFFNIVHTTLPILRSQGGGSYVSVITTATKRYPVRDSLSAVPKAAVEMLTKAIAREEGKFGIRANCVAPGMIEVGLGTRMLEKHFTNEVIEKMKYENPLRRFGIAEEVAEAVVFLASSRASYITGQTLAVDGGWQV